MERRLALALSRGSVALSSAGSTAHAAVEVGTWVLIEELAVLAADALLVQTVGGALDERLIAGGAGPLGLAEALVVHGCVLGDGGEFALGVQTEDGRVGLGRHGEAFAVVAVVLAEHTSGDFRSDSLAAGVYGLLDAAVLSVVALVTEAHSTVADTAAQTVAGTQFLAAVDAAPALVALAARAGNLDLSGHLLDSTLGFRGELGVVSGHIRQHALSVPRAVVLADGDIAVGSAPPVATHASTVVAGAAVGAHRGAGALIARRAGPAVQTVALHLGGVAHTVIGGRAIVGAARNSAGRSRPGRIALAALERADSLVLALVAVLGAHLLLASVAGPAALALAHGLGGVADARNAFAALAAVEVAVERRAVSAMESGVALAASGGDVAGSIAAAVVGAVEERAVVAVELAGLARALAGLGIALAATVAVLGTQALFANLSSESVAAVAAVVLALAVAGAVAGAADDILAQDTRVAVEAHTGARVAGSVEVAALGAACGVADEAVPSLLALAAAVVTHTVAGAVVGAHPFGAIESIESVLAEALGSEAESVAGAVTGAADSKLGKVHGGGGRRRIDLE